MRGRPITTPVFSLVWIFQSTPPCGGDFFIAPLPDGPHDFNPRPLAGATRFSPCFDVRQVISIHAPLRGRPNFPRSRFALGVFQSTPPCGGDQITYSRQKMSCISIHAPLRGRRTVQNIGYLYQHISIHAPLRGRLKTYPIPQYRGKISIHAPLRGRQSPDRYNPKSSAISIHAPLRGRPSGAFRHGASEQFQSTPPCGGDFWPEFKRRC